MLAIAGPILTAQLATNGMGTVDSLMAGRLGTAALAAVTVGYAVWTPLALILIGLGMATSARVAHVAAQSLPAVGGWVRQGLWLNLGMSLLVAVLLLNAAPLFRWMDVEPTAARMAGEYLFWVALGMPGLALFQMLRANGEGLGITRPAMLIALTGLALKIPLNYWLMHGGLGVPALGPAGCGLATALLLWFDAIAMALVVRLHPRLSHTGTLARLEGPRLGTLFSLLALGLPVAGAIFAEVSIFGVVALLVAPFGNQVVAAHAIAISVTSIVFMVPLSWSLAVSVRVAHYQGAGDGQAARRCWRLALKTALVFAALSASLLWLGGEWLARLYTGDARVVGIATGLLALAALFQFSDCLQVTAAGALRGYHDTRVTFVLTVLAYWVVGLPLGYALGNGWLGEPMGAHGFWSGLVAGLTVAAILLNWRLFRIPGSPDRAAA